MRTYLNKYIVFFATGLWHGGNLTFILWGLIHGTCAVFEETKAGKWIMGLFRWKTNWECAKFFTVFTHILIRVKDRFYEMTLQTIAENVYGFCAYFPEGTDLTGYEIYIEPVLNRGTSFLKNVKI